MGLVEDKTDVLALWTLLAGFQKQIKTHHTAVSEASELALMRRTKKLRMITKNIFLAPSPPPNAKH